MFLFLRMSASYDIHFWVDVYAKALTDVVANGLAEVDNFLTCGATAIDEDKGLLIVYARFAQ
jgi:hypothetical protein